MNWYKQHKVSSFIDSVQLAECVDNCCTIWISGKKYEYQDVDHDDIKKKIYVMKEKASEPKNLRNIGKELSKLIKDLDRNRKDKRDKPKKTNRSKS